MKIVATVLTAALVQGTNAADGVIKSNLRGELRKEWARVLNVNEFTPMLTDDEEQGVTVSELFTIGETVNGYTPPGIVSALCEMNDYFVSLPLSYDSRSAIDPRFSQSLMVWELTLSTRPLFVPSSTTSS